MDATPSEAANTNDQNEQNRPSAFSPTTALRVIRSIMGDRHLTHAQRIATAAVVLQADSATGLAWASYRQLRRDYGLASDSISKALRGGGDDQRAGNAIGRYLVPVRRGRQGAVQYRVLVEAAEDGRSAPASEAQTTDSAPDPGALQTPERSILAGQALHFGGSSAPVSGAILTPYSDPLSKNPPTPQGGEGDAPSGGRDQDTAAQSPAPSPQTLDAVLSRIDTAYAEVYGRRLPRKWKRGIRRLYENGDADRLMQIDAGTLRAVERWRKEGKRSLQMGLGTVMLYLDERAAAEQEKKHAQRQAEAQARAAERERREVELRRELEAKQKRDHFASLSDEQRDGYWEAARTVRIMGKRGKPDYELIAIEMAWKDRESQPVEVAVG